MNILLTSVGRRSYMVKYFKEALGETGEVHVSNSSSLTPAFLYADKTTVTPIIYDNDYIPFLLNYTSENKINAVMSLFDIDLPILSKNKALFEEKGITVIVSDKDVINICNDKIKTVQFLTQNGIQSPRTYNSLAEVTDAIERGEVTYPFIIKPRWGMGSIGVFEANNEEELYVLYNKTLNEIKSSYLKYESSEELSKGIIIQEKLLGTEYGLDIINDLNGQYITTIVKQKFQMRAGETDSAKTVDSPLIRELGELIGTTLGHIGNLDVDIFVEKNIPYVLEMNARFGGGYPFSHIAGVNLPQAIVHWLKNEKAPDELFDVQYNVISHKDIDIVKLKNVDID